MMLAVMLRSRRSAFEPTKMFWNLGIMLGFVAFSIPFALTYWGQKQIATGLASVLFATFPFWVAALSHVYLTNERMNLWKLIGMALGFVGILVIFSSDLSLEDAFTVWGMAAIIASALIQAVSMVIMRKHAGPFDSGALVMVGMAIGAVALGLFSFFVEDYSTIRFDWDAALAILYLGTFASVVTFVTYFWLLKQIEAVFLSLTAFVTPIIAVVTGVIVLNETVSTDLLLGSLLVLVGIITTNGNDVAEVLRRGRGFFRQKNDASASR
jgi:drug/metabolite transporter (DMT)-like permease